MLGATSVSNLVDRHRLRLARQQERAEVLAQIHTSERQIKHHQAQLIADRRQARHLVKTRAAQAREVQALLTQQSTLLKASRANRAPDPAAAGSASEHRPARRGGSGGSSRGGQGRHPSGWGSPSTNRAAEARRQRRGSGGGAPSRFRRRDHSGEKAVQIAEQELGVKYVWGGASPAGFDCSGLTMWVYAQLGIYLDHYTGSQWNEGVHVPETSWLQATSCSSSPPSATSACTSATARSSTPPTPARWCRSPACPTPGIRPSTRAPSESLGSVSRGRVAYSYGHRMRAGYRGRGI